MTTNNGHIPQSTCGQHIAGPGQMPVPSVVVPPITVIVRPEPTSGTGVASLVFALIAMLVGGVPFFIGLVLSFVPTVLAILLGIIGIATAKPGSGSGTAIAGLILGCCIFLGYFVGFGWLW